MYKHVLRTFAIVFVLTMTIQVQAQDPIFGQFYASPTHLNPAMTGVFEGSLRLNANYRDQWSSVLSDKPFRTTAIGAEYKLQVFQGDFAAFSLNAIHDQAGEGNHSLDRANLGFSYLKQLSGNRYQTSNQYLVAGGQVGYGQYSLDPANLWFSKQFDNSTATVDYGSNSGENFASMSSDPYLDYNAGILWYGIFDDNFSLFFGGALQHLSEPNISFFANSEDFLRTRWVGHFGGELPLGDGLSVLPAMMFTGQGVNKTSIFGSNIRYTNHDWNELAMRVGAWGHISNKFENEMLLHSIIFTTVLELERFNLGISYDVNTSSVTNATDSRGGFEFSIIYTQPSKTRYKVKCPKY